MKDKDIKKAIDKKIAELYKDVEFRLQLEEETKNISSIEDINEYNKKAFELSKKEVTPDEI